MEMGATRDLVSCLSPFSTSLTSSFLSRNFPPLIFPHSIAGFLGFKLFETAVSEPLIGSYISNAEHILFAPVSPAQPQSQLKPVKKCAECGDPFFSPLGAPLAD